MKLYSGPLSLFTQKVRIALAEKGLEYERIEVGWSLQNRYIPHHPDVVALNPKREVPVLVDGDVVVCDSTLINEYLEERFPEVPLLPREVAARARCRQQEAAADEIWFPNVWDLIEERFYPSAAGEPDSERAKKAGAALHGLYAGFDRELEGRDYYCDEFSVADIATFVFAQAATVLGAAPPPELERMAGWLERMRERPPIRREIEAANAVVATALASGGAQAQAAAG